MVRVALTRGEEPGAGIGAADTPIPPSDAAE
jgi:hypothetical protein